MTRLLNSLAAVLFIAVHLILAAAFGGFFMFAYPIFLLGAGAEQGFRLARRFSRR